MSSRNRNNQRQKPPQRQVAQVSVSSQVSTQQPQSRVAELETQLADYKNLEEEYTQTREEIITRIQSEEESIRSAYFAQRIQGIEQREGETQEAAERILQTARTDAEAILEMARVSAAELEATVKEQLANAEADAEAIRDKARAEGDEAIAKAMSEAQSMSASLIAELQEKLRIVEEREREINRRETQLALEQADIADERDTLSQFQERCNRRWKECSPGRLAELSQDLDTLRSYSEVDKATIQQFQDENTRLRGLVTASNGRNPDTLLQELVELRDRLRRYEDERANLPSLEEMDRLRAEANEVVRLRETSRTLKLQLVETQERASRIELGARELDQMKAQAGALRILNDEFKKEAAYIKDSLEGRTGERFPELVRLDQADMQVSPVPLRTVTLDLKKLVEHVRNYAATQSPPLYYSVDTIRAFVAGLAISRLTILQGLSGTGKTSLPRVFAEAIGGVCERIPVHSSWRDRHELLGYNNDFNKRFSETEFTKAVYRAGLPSQEGRLWLIVLDEMNLARLEYYFADFLSILEETNTDRWLVDLMSYSPKLHKDDGPRRLVDGYKLRIPTNLWFIGTANHDESTFEITDKVYDRAQVLEFQARQKVFPGLTPKDAVNINIQSLQKTFTNAMLVQENCLSDEDEEYLHHLDLFLQKKFDATFGNRIELQISRFVPVFVACGGKKEEAVDYFVARKVFRKLLGQHDPHVVSRLEELKREVVAGRWKSMPCCMELLDRKIVDLGGNPA